MKRLGSAPWREMVSKRWSCATRGIRICRAARSPARSKLARRASLLRPRHRKEPVRIMGCAGRFYSDPLLGKPRQVGPSAAPAPLSACARSAARDREAQAPASGTASDAPEGIHRIARRSAPSCAPVCAVDATERGHPATHLIVPDAPGCPPALSPEIGGSTLPSAGSAYRDCPQTAAR